MNKCVYTCPMYRPLEQISCRYWDDDPQPNLIDNRCRHCIGVKVEGNTICKLFVDEEGADIKIVRRILRKVGRHQKRIRHRMKGAKNE